ncbi:MAG TPA: hypothetical protein VFQ60_02795 [Patescibacteria group bacterium]|nr:hypothetical protein [Patescibacteria group bacterium]
MGKTQEVLEAKDDDHVPWSLVIKTGMLVTIPVLLSYLAGKLSWFWLEVSVIVISSLATTIISVALHAKNQQAIQLDGLLKMSAGKIEKLTDDARLRLMEFLDVATKLRRRRTMAITRLPATACGGAWCRRLLTRIGAVNFAGISSLSDPTTKSS